MPALPQREWLACKNRICGCKAVICCDPFAPKGGRVRETSENTVQQTYTEDENGCSHADPSVWQTVDYKTLTHWRLRKQKCNHCNKYLIPPEQWEDRKIGEEEDRQYREREKDGKRVWGWE